WMRPANGLALAFTARIDGSTDIQVDSSDVSLARVGLPVTLAGGAQWAATRRLTLGGHATWRGWSRASDGLEEIGGTGAVNTLELAGGLEFVRNEAHPQRFPLRAGLHWSQLPFPLTPGGSPSEFGLA